MATTYSPSTVINGLVLSLDAGNPKSYSTNVHPSPLDIDAWTTVGNNCTLSRDPTVTDSPVGSLPLKMAVTGADAYTATYNNSTWNLAPALVGQAWTVSVWVKASVATTGSLFIFGANSSGAYVTAPLGSINISTGWTRVSYTATFTDATTAYIQIRLGAGGAGVGVNVWWDGLQVEKNSARTTFNPRTNVSGTWTDLTNTINGTVVGTVAPIATDITTCFDFTANLGLNHSSAISGFSWNPHPVPTTGSFTFNCWVKNVPATVGQQAFFSNSADANGFRFGIGANGVYYLIGPTYTEGLLAFSSFTNTQWNNVCVVFDRNGIFNSGAAQLRGYLNGSLYGSVTLPASQTAWPGGGYLGAYMAKGLGTFDSYSGKLSKFEIYARALSVAEISQNFNAMRGRHGL